MTLRRFSWVLIASLAVIAGGQADEPTSLFYERLRERQLFSLVEADCLRRLSNQSLDEYQRGELVLELSRTYAAHAWETSGPEQADLWQRARQIIVLRLSESKESTRRELLETQLALLDLGQSQWWLLQSELRPDARTPRREGFAFAQSAVDRLTTLEQSLATTLRQNSADASGTTKSNKNSARTLSPFERRRLWQQVRFQLGTARLVQAKLSPLTSADRAAALVAAEEWFTSLVGGPPSERITFEAQLGLAETLRWRDDLPRAIRTLETMEKSFTDELPFDLRERFVIERTRCFLAAHQPAEAATWLLEQRRRLVHSTEQVRDWGARSSELVYWQIVVELALDRAAQERGDDKLAAEIWDHVSATVATFGKEQGGYWFARAAYDWQVANEIREYGRELAELVRDARQTAMNETASDALAKLDRAILAAKAAQQTKLQWDLSDTRAALLFQAKRYEEAASAFRELALAPRHPRSASANLLWAISVGRLLEQHPTDEHKSDFVRILTSLREQFPDGVEAHEAAWLLGQWAERHGEYREAIQILGTIAESHPRHDSAWAMISRCHERRLAQLRVEKSAMLATEEEEASRQLSLVAEQFVAKLASSDDSAAIVRDADEPAKPIASKLGEPQTELLVRLARIQLQRTTVDVPQADKWLSAAIAHSTDAAWVRMAKQLRIVSLAAQRKTAEAEQLLVSLDGGDPNELLGLLDGLNRVVEHSDASTQRLLADLQLRTTDKLLASSDRLSHEQRVRLWRTRAEALVSTGQPSQAIAVYQQLLKDAPRDAKFLRAAATVAESVGSREAFQQAKPFWRRLEGTCKAGSSDWFEARWHVIRCCQKLGESSEAEKLLKVTQLLYPELGGPDWKPRFESLRSP